MKDNFIKIQKNLLTYSSGKEILVLLFIANNYNYRLVIDITNPKNYILVEKKILKQK